MAYLLAGLKYATGAACAYEAYRIFTGTEPTVSTLCGRHVLLVPVIVGGLALHLYPKKATT